MPVNIQWQSGQPPAPKRGRRGDTYDEIVTTLKERPGSWAIVSTVSPADAAGRTVGYTAPGFEALRTRGCEVAQRRNTDGGIDLWASWPRHTTRQLSKVQRAS